jgi:hypothetical protein
MIIRKPIVHSELHAKLFRIALVTVAFIGLTIWLFVPMQK